MAAASVNRSLRALPKGHLHLHLEAAMRPATLSELADEHGLDVPALGPNPSFPEFIGVYEAATACLRREDDLRRLLREVAEDAATDGAVWVELHVYPPLWRGRFGGDDEALDLALEAARAATVATGVGIGFVLAADRTLDPADAVRLAHLGVARRDRGVATFGLANDETHFPPAPFAEAFRVARDGGLLAAPHAGELAGPASVEAALDDLGADRLGHGVRATEDPQLLRRLADEGVVCDVCPTSNLVLGLYPSLREHALRALLEAGVPVTLNTDDPLLFGAGLLDEYEAVQRAFDLDDAAMAGIARTSITASGAPGPLKQAALTAIDAWCDEEGTA